MQEILLVTFELGFSAASLLLDTDAKNSGGIFISLHGKELKYINDFLDCDKPFKTGINTARVAIK